MVDQVRARQYAKFQPVERLLLGPGPSPVDQQVLAAMGAPVLGHLDPLFLQCMEDIREMLHYVFETNNRATLPVSGTGSAGMESAIVNAIEPGDEVVVCISGYFGERMLEMVERAGGKPTVVRSEWGEPVEFGEIQNAMRSGHPRALAIVHAETSTGVLQNLDGVANLAHERGALLLVDAVTSLGTHPVSVDRTGIDICFSCSQKGIGAPPGLAPITFSEQAVDRVASRRTKVQSWYLDVTAIRRYWGRERAYHHTAPISMNYALREALRLLCEEGLEARWQRHKLNHQAFVAGIQAMGLQMLVQPEHRMWALNTVCVPEGVDDGQIRKRLLEESRIEIGGGLGPLKGRVWRIGLMGFGSTRENVLLLLNSLHRTLASEGFVCPHGIQAAEGVYESVDLSGTAEFKRR